MTLILTQEPCLFKISAVLSQLGCQPVTGALSLAWTTMMTSAQVNLHCNLKAWIWLTLSYPSTQPPLLQPPSTETPPGYQLMHCGFLLMLGHLWGGFCAFGGFHGMQSDHWQLWIEVDNSTILRNHLPSSYTPPRFKLRSDDPWSRNRYIKLARQAYSKLRVPNSISSLQGLLLKCQQGDLSFFQNLIDTYDGLHQDTSSARLEIESKLHTGYVGGVPWSSQLQTYRGAVDFWKRIVRLRKGIKTSQTVPRDLLKKLHIYLGFYTDLPSAQFQLKLAYRFYQAAKLWAPDWRDGHNQSLIEAQIAEGKPHSKISTQIKARMKREQQQRDLGLASRIIRRATKKNAVLKAIAPDEEGLEWVLEEQDEMVPAMAASNLAWQQQCQGPPSLMPSFLDGFGYFANTPAALSGINSTYVPPVGTDPYLVELLSCLAIPSTIRKFIPFPFAVNGRDNWLAWMK